MIILSINFRTPSVMQEMGGWGLRFSDRLVTLNARVMPQEKIVQENGEVGQNKSRETTLLSKIF